MSQHRITCLGQPKFLQVTLGVDEACEVSHAALGNSGLHQRVANFLLSQPNAFAALLQRLDVLQACVGLAAPPRVCELFLLPALGLLLTSLAARGVLRKPRRRVWRWRPGPHPWRALRRLLTQLRLTDIALIVTCVSLLAAMVVVAAVGTPGSVGDYVMAALADQTILLFLIFYVLVWPSFAGLLAASSSPIRFFLFRFDLDEISKRKNPFRLTSHPQAFALTPTVAIRYEFNTQVPLWQRRTGKDDHVIKNDYPRSCLANIRLLEHPKEHPIISSQHRIQSLCLLLDANPTATGPTHSSDHNRPWIVNAGKAAVTR